MFNSNNSIYRRSHTNTLEKFRPSFITNSLQSPPSSINPIIAIYDDFNIKLSILDQKIDEINELIEQHLLPTFDSNENDFYNTNIRKITREITNRINILAREVKRPIKTKDPEVARIIFNLQQCQRLKLSKSVQKFRNIEAKKKNDIDNDVRIKKDSDPIGDIYKDFNPMLDNVNQELLQQNQHESSQQDEELAELMTMMNELNAMFRDLSLLVFEQGTILDRIDTRIEMAIQNVEKGNQELEIANQHQSSNCFYVYIFTVMALIGVCILIMIFRKR